MLSQIRDLPPPPPKRLAFAVKEKKRKYTLKHTTNIYVENMYFHTKIDFNTIILYYEN